MSETQVKDQDVKQDPVNTDENNSASTEQQDNSIPYSRFKEVNDSKKELETKLAEFESAEEKRRQSELEKKGEYETLVSDLRTKLEKAETKANAFDEYQSARRDALLSKLDENDRDIYGGLSLDKLEAHVERISNKPKIQSGKPGKPSGFQTIRDAADALMKGSITEKEYADARKGFLQSN